MSELLIGCGGKRTKELFMPGREEWNGLVTLDMNDDHKPDVVHDLTSLPYPFEDNSFDEIHAYEVLEHTGQQGDWRFFFDQWSEFWRILKPGGLFIGHSPDYRSAWAWGDPGHTRLVMPQQLTFLNQPEYEKQVGRTPMTDYRFCYKADFEPRHLKTEGETFWFVLQAIKPTRCKT